MTFEETVLKGRSSSTSIAARTSGASSPGPSASGSSPRTALIRPWPRRTSASVGARALCGACTSSPAMRRGEAGDVPLAAPCSTSSSTCGPRARPISSTSAVTLSAENGRALYVPERFAHGYQTLEDATSVCYQSSEFYAPDAEGGLSPFDPRLGDRVAAGRRADFTRRTPDSRSASTRSKARCARAWHGRPGIDRLRSALDCESAVLPEATMKVVLFCGGLGMRLREYSEAIPSRWCRSATGPSSGT